MKRFKITVNGTPYEVEVEELQGGAAVSQPAQTVAAPQAPAAPAPRDEKPAPAAPAQAATTSAGPGSVPAPMPGVIMNIRVKPGQDVKRGDVLLTLEAMKMENEILSPRDGRIKAIFVQAGQSVNPQDPLLDLE